MPFKNNLMLYHCSLHYINWLKKIVIIDATKYCDCLNTLNELNSVLQSKIDLGRQCPEICSLAHGPRGAVGYPLVKWSDWHGTSQCLVPKWTWCSFYQPIYGMKGSVNFPSSRIEPWTCGVAAQGINYCPIGLRLYTHHRKIFSFTATSSMSPYLRNINL